MDDWWVSLSVIYNVKRSINYAKPFPMNDEVFPQLFSHTVQVWTYFVMQMDQ